MSRHERPAAVQLFQELSFQSDCHLCPLPDSQSHKLKQIDLPTSISGFVATAWASSTFMHWSMSSNHPPSLRPGSQLISNCATFQPNGSCRRSASSGSEQELRALFRLVLSHAQHVLQETKSSTGTDVQQEKSWAAASTPSEHLTISMRLAMPLISEPLS